jgi:SAM-dependent methyltransferase
MSKSSQSVSAGSGYEQLPFKSKADRTKHPDRIATIAYLYGLVSPPLERCRFLDFGCGTGSDCLALALELPGARVIGYDPVEGPMEQSRFVAGLVGVENLKLVAGELPPTEEQFDYIVSHGVVSWVGADESRRIIRTIAELLAPEGLACISFNALPGWNYRSPIRELLRCYDRPAADANTRVKNAREILRGFRRYLPEESSSGIVLHRELKRLATESDAYLFHEFLSAESTPYLLSELVAIAQSYGLRYVGDASPYRLMRERLEYLGVSGGVLPVPASVGTSAVAQEQFMDMLFGMSFRSAIFCRDDRDVFPLVDRERFASCSFACSLKPLESEFAVEPSSGRRGWMDLRGRRYVTKTDEESQFLSVVACAWPAYVSGRDVLAQISGGSRALGPMLHELFISEILDVSRTPPLIAQEVSERPVGHPLARFEAQQGSLVTTYRHESVELGELECLVLTLLDGTISEANLVERLAVWVDSGQYTLEDDGDSLREPELVKARLTVLIDGVMQNLLQAGLLAKE